MQMNAGYIQGRDQPHRIREDLGQSNPQEAITTQSGVLMTETIGQGLCPWPCRLQAEGLRPLQAPSLRWSTLQEPT